jgi:tetratricopeptide (TPR) repeat protein
MKNLKSTKKIKVRKMRGYLSNSFLNSTSLSKELSFAFFQEALKLFKKGKYLDCLKTLDIVIKYNSTYEAIYSLKALIFRLILGDFKVAIKELNQALLINPNSKKLITLKRQIHELENNQLYNHFYI